MNMPKYFRACLRLCGLIVVLQSVQAHAQSNPDSLPKGVAAINEALPRVGAMHQSLADAWWTGPVLAAGAGTLPPGHLLIEPYLYDVIGAHSNGFGSRTYVVYGLADRVSVGLIPTAGYNKESNGRSSSGVGIGDLTLLAQYRLTQFHQGSWIPTISFVAQETLPTGKYDRLERPSDGFGGGSYTTTLAFYSQSYFWLPNGRILRARLDLSQAFSNAAKVEGVSVYGTDAGFRGHAKPGSSFLGDAAAEYSVTRNWVLAFDFSYGASGNNRVIGYSIVDNAAVQNPEKTQVVSGSSAAFSFVPAIEYSWTSNVGVILGTRFIPASHNTSATITPVVAINLVH